MPAASVRPRFVVRPSLEAWPATPPPPTRPASLTPPPPLAAVAAAGATCCLAGAAAASAAAAAQASSQPRLSLGLLLRPPTRRRRRRIGRRLEGLRAVAVEPLPPLQRLQRSLRFYAGVLPVLGQYEVRPWLNKLGFERKPEEELVEEMHEWGSEKLIETLLDLQGFYVKSGQVLSTRVDLFPEPYTRRLSVLQDALPPVPAQEIREEVARELCGGGALTELFREFDDEPLGTASIAQVHRAVLKDGRQVAVKVLRPGCEAILRGDITNLKVFANALRGKLPVDYLPVFCELERALDGELDLLSEAQSALKVAASIAHDPDGHPVEPPLRVPLPLPGLATRNVLVMEYIDGTPLSGLARRARELGIDLQSSLGKGIGRRILRSLTDAYGRMIFSSGFIHGDPHPGNIFLTEAGGVALIDCGQVAQIFRAQRLLVAEAVLATASYDGSRASIKALADAVRGLGATFQEGTEDEDAAAAATVLYLFGDHDLAFPGEYSREEFSDKSPLRALAAFPTELVLLGRASVLVKGIAARLGIDWSVARSWEPLAKATIVNLCDEEGCSMPAWALRTANNTSPWENSSEGAQGRLRFGEVARSCAQLIRRWGLAKAADVARARARDPSSVAAGAAAADVAEPA